jgi:hypothetical protein
MNNYEKIFNKITELNRPYPLKIDTIDGVKVYTYIKKSHNSLYFYIQIENEILKVDNDDDDDDDDIYNDDCIFKNIYGKVIKNNDELDKLFIEILPKLKYYPEIDEFKYNEYEDEDIDLILIKMMRKIPKNDNVKLNINFDNCCVCYEECITKTNCKHSLCRKCIEKINEEVCPMCRTSL